MKAWLSIFPKVAIVSVVTLVAAVTNGQQKLPTQHVPQAVVSGAAKRIGAFPGTQRLKLSLMLPLRNEAILTQLLDQLHDPSSPDYRHFLSVSQFTEQFGPTADDYKLVSDWAKAKGFTVDSAPANRLIVGVTGTVSEIGKAFNISMSIYHHPTEDRVFFSPDQEPTIDAALPLSHVTGLDDYSVPQPEMVKAKPGNNANAQTGSGPSSLFLPGDMRVAYYGASALTGSGQCVGLAEYGGYTMSDVANTFYGAATYSGYTLTYKTGGVTYTIPINNIPIGGYVVGDSGDVGEQALDIAAAVGMAPGLSQVRVYTAPNDFTSSGGYVFPPNNDDTAIFNAMASDTTMVCRQLSESWHWAPETQNLTYNDDVFKEFQAQGQTFFNASGDDSSWPDSQGYYYPEEDPYVTAVGGTVLATNGAGGSWQSEIAWGGSNTSCSAGTGSGGGISPAEFLIPTFQTLSGVINAANHGSSTYRNSPDVAAQADCSNYYCSGSCSAAEGGTSYAAPRWAGFLALVNQQYSSNTGVANSGIGGIDTPVYEIGVSANYNQDFHDITVGDNYDSNNPSLYPAVTGYDLVTGWGSPNGPSLITALLNPPIPTPPYSGYETGSAPKQCLDYVGNYEIGASQTAVGSLGWNLSSSSYESIIDGFYYTISDSSGILAQGELTAKSGTVPTSRLPVSAPVVSGSLTGTYSTGTRGLEKCAIPYSFSTTN